jgi:hypothetical protein
MGHHTSWVPSLFTLSYESVPVRRHQSTKTHLGSVCQTVGRSLTRSILYYGASHLLGTISLHLQLRKIYQKHQHILKVGLSFSRSILNSVCSVLWWVHISYYLQLRKTMLVCTSTYPPKHRHILRVGLCLSRHTPALSFANEGEERWV